MGQNNYFIDTNSSRITVSIPDDGRKYFVQVDGEVFSLAVTSKRQKLINRILKWFGVRGIFKVGE